MASKADKHASGARVGTSNPPPPSAGAHAAAGSSVSSQVSVLLVQVEALHEDETIRVELKKQGFKVKHQALVHLSREDARHFIYEVCDPNSTLHHQLHHAESGVGVVADTETPTSFSEAAEPPTASPRDKLATPRALVGASQGEKLDGENLEGAVHALASGPVLMLAVEKPNAVNDLLELVGPFNPELWVPQASPNCLRARFGKNREELGVRCSLQESTVALEIEFLLAHSGPNRENLRKQSQSSHQVISKGSGSSSSTRKSADVNLEQLLDFLFPSHLQHPNSAGRLFVFGLYGPLDAKARLRSGEKGLHVVTDLELTTMSRRMEREDILSVYKMCSLSQEEEEQVLAQVDQTMKSFPQYTPRDIKALFQSLKREDRSASRSGNLSFHAMQEVILKERCRRVLCMKEQLHPALAPPILNKYRLTLKRIMKTKDEIAPATLFLKDSGFTGAENATLVARLLSNHAFEICHLDDGNSPSLTQNVRLLRDQIRPTDETREPWSPNCQRK